MKNDRRRCLKTLLALPLAVSLPGWADELVALRERGRLRVAVYNDFSPYSKAGGKGIDADIGRALAARLGLAAEIVGYNADEDVNDDLRNMVWKGHYLGTSPADVMLHVPVDEHLARANDKVRIFGPYHREKLAMARDPARVTRPPQGSAAVALDVFTREKIGVETATLPDAFLLGVLNGRLRENVVHFRSVKEAVDALRKGELAAVLAQRSELEDVLRDQSRIAIDPVGMPELATDSWQIGMAVKAEALALAEALAAAMRDLLADGEIARIFAAHGVSHGLS